MTPSLRLIQPLAAIALTVTGFLLPSPAHAANTRGIQKALKFGMIAEGETVLEKLEIAKKAGFEGVEFNGPLGADKVKEIGAALRQTGLVVPGLVAGKPGKSLADPDDAIRNQAIADVRQTLREAKALGGTTVLIYSGYVDEKNPYADAYRRMEESMRALIPAAKETGIKMALENVWNNLFLSPLEAARFVDTLDSEYVGWYFDVGNCVRFAWPEHWVRVLDKRIMKLDIKEYSRVIQKEEGLWKGFGVELMEGSIDWPAVVRALDDVKYAGGWASAEVRGGDLARLTDIAQRMDTIFSLPGAKAAPKPGAGAAAGAKAKKKDLKTTTSLFDGKTLDGWRSINFGGEGEVVVEKGNLLIGMGDPFTGVVYDEGEEDLPKTGYEISLEAMKLVGNDFFCALTFPVAESHATFVVGGWGGAVVGISNLDGMDASENETASYLRFETDQWYKIRVRVTRNKILAWIDDKKLVDVDIRDREVSLRPGPIDLCAPLGIASFQTRAAFRKMALRKL